MQDKPRTGRKRSLTPAMLQELSKVAVSKRRTTAISSLRLAQHMQRQFGSRPSAWTVRRWMRARKWSYTQASKAPLLKPSHKLKRLRWAQHHIRKRTCFSKWMFTDSKIFYVESIGTGRGVKFWAPPGPRPAARRCRRPS